MVIVDSLVRRAIDGELDVQSLTPITSPKERRDTWEQLTGRQMASSGSTSPCNTTTLKTWLARFRPDAVVHLAEQRAAPIR